MAKKTYVVQRNGQVTLPPELREEYRLKPGDEVRFIKGSEGWIITKINPDPMQLLDQLGEVLKAKGMTLEQLMEDGETIRESLVKEIYDLPPGQNQDA